MSKILIAVKAGAIYTYNTNVEENRLSSYPGYKRHDVTIIALETKTNLEHKRFKAVTIWTSSHAEAIGLKSGEEISMDFDVLKDCSEKEVIIKSKLPLITEF